MKANVPIRWALGAGLWACVAHAQLTNRTILHAFHFSKLAGRSTLGRLLEGSDGWLYGVTSESSPQRLGERDKP